MDIGDCFRYVCYVFISSYMLSAALLTNYLFSLLDGHRTVDEVHYEWRVLSYQYFLSHAFE